MRGEARVDAVSTPVGSVRIAPMSQKDAEMVANWEYEPPYDFYDWHADAGDLEELLDPALRRDRYFSAFDSTGGLIGFYSFRPEGDVVVVGLGLRPELTGRGLGLSFLEDGLAHARDRHRPATFRLRVAEFNTRAITVYERAGFTCVRSFLHATNGGTFPFVEMERRA